MKRITIIYVSLIVLLMGLVFVNMTSGSIDLTFAQILKIIAAGDASDMNSKIILMIRLPRIVEAIFLGGALALSGYLLQVFFSNPIAGPFVLGISSGAKLVVAVLMVAAMKYSFSMTSAMMVIAAFAGSMIAMVFVLLVSARVKSMSVLVVCGVMLGYICSAATELLVTFADDSNIVNLHNWSLGTFSSAAWRDANYYIPIIIAGVVAALFLSKSISAYMLGENYARSIGVNVKLFRVLLILVSSILSATVTAFAGPISFVGIAMPHLVRLIFKSNKPLVVIPASFLAGAVFCLFSDLLARSLFSPMELSISTITAIFGAPVVISMMLKARRGN